MSAHPSPRFGITGSFNKAGDPCVPVTITGAFPGGGLKFDAILDTGFSGFVSIPTIRAFPLGLPLYGTSESVLADGTTVTSLTARCCISVTSTLGHAQPYALERFGVATLQYASQEVLLGMDFLRSFGLAMLLTKELVFLFAESDAAKVAESTPGSEPTPSSQVSQAP